MGLVGPLGPVDPKPHNSASEGMNFYLVRCLGAAILIIIVGSFTLHAFGMADPLWIKEALFLLFGILGTAIKTSGFGSAINAGPGGTINTNSDPSTETDT